jgi:hypothetical protein
VFNAGGHIHHTGVVDQARDAAHGLIDFVEQTQDVGLNADIRLERLCFAAHGVNLRYHVVGSGCVPGVIDGDCPALSGSKQSAGRAYAPAAAGDQ